MPVYAYKGVTANGRNTRGHMDAENERSARSRLRRDGPGCDVNHELRKVVPQATLQIGKMFA